MKQYDTRPNERSVEGRFRNQKQLKGVRTRFRTLVNKSIKDKRDYRTDFDRSGSCLIVRGNLTLEDTEIDTFEGFTVKYIN